MKSEFYIKQVCTALPVRSGWGYGWRTYVALAVLCIPVIIQPLVEQAYHDVLPYSELALVFDPVDLERLPEMLKAIEQKKICQMRQAALRYRRLLLWRQPEGLAYEMLQLSLCRRAVKVFSTYRPMSQLPSWAACTNLTVEDFLA